MNPATSQDKMADEFHFYFGKKDGSAIQWNFNQVKDIPWRLPRHNILNFILC